MIFDSSDLQCGHVVVSRNAADVGPDAIFDFRDNPGLPILSAESEMVM